MFFTPAGSEGYHCGPRVPSWPRHRRCARERGRFRSRHTGPWPSACAFHCDRIPRGVCGVSVTEQPPERASERRPRCPGSGADTLLQHPLPDSRTPARPWPPAVLLSPSRPFPGLGFFQPDITLVPEGCFPSRWEKVWNGTVSEAPASLWIVCLPRERRDQSGQDPTNRDGGLDQGGRLFWVLPFPSRPECPQTLAAAWPWAGYAPVPPFS